MTGVGDGNYVTETVTITASGTSLANSSTDVTNQDVEINVQIDGVDIANGGTYTFPNVDLNYTTPAITFVVQNTGGGIMRLTNVPVISIGGTNADQFVITQPNTYLINSGSSISFVINFSPTSLGIKNAILNFPNDDPDENPYTINISGTAVERVFIDNGETVSYPEKGLMFKKCSQGQTWSTGTCTGTAGTYQYCEYNTDICNVPGYLNGLGAVSQAYNTCNELNAESGFAGHTNWRVPLYTELLFLLKINVGFPSIDTLLFPNTVNYRYWSSSPEYSTNGITVRFETAQLWGYWKTYGYYVRCVRTVE